jgi:hypothetical protein
MPDRIEEFDIPEFTVEEQRRINKVYKELRDKHEAFAKAGFRWRKPPKDFYRDAADKERHAMQTAGQTKKNYYE